jgi:hypothetical protein
MKTLLLISVCCFQLSAFAQGFFQPRIGGTNLVGWWTFNEGTGTTAIDNSGKAHNGTLVNSPVWTNGVIGSGINFGSNYVGVVYDIPRNSTTFSFWLKTTKTDQGIMTYSSTSYLYAGFTDRSFIITTNGFVLAYVYSGTVATSFLTSTQSVVDGVWHHVGLTFTTTNKNLYVDGIKQATSTNGIQTTTGSMLYLTIGWASANGANTPTSPYFSGALDDLRIFNKVNSDSEITQLYNSGHGTQQ